MDIELNTVLSHLSPMGRLEWELAVEKAKNADLTAKLKQVMPFVVIPNGGDEEGQ